MYLSFHHGVKGDMPGMEDASMVSGVSFIFFFSFFQKVKMLDGTCHPIPRIDHLRSTKPPALYNLVVPEYPHPPPGKPAQKMKILSR